MRREEKSIAVLTFFDALISGGFCLPPQHEHNV
jgi:hypothetical protein